MAEKTEQATPKKLRDARKKGQVAKSQDFSSAFTFIVSISTTLVLSGYLYNQLASYIVSTFKSISKSDSIQEHITDIINEAILVICNTSLPIGLITSLTGLFVSFIIVGPLFSFESMTPDLKKLNPITN